MTYNVIGRLGKTVIVTGGAQGLAEAVFRCYAQEGATVAVNYSDPFW